MNKIYKFSLMVVISTVLLDSKALAGFSNNTYFALGAGVAMPNKITGYDYASDNEGAAISVSRKMKNSPVYRLAIGKAFNDFRGELEFTYRKFYDQFAMTTNQQNAGTDVKTKVNLKSNSYFLNGYYDFVNYSKVFIPYVGAGLGVSRNSPSEVIKFGGEDTSFLTKKNTSFAWNVRLGSMIHINQNVAFDLSYKYADLGGLTGTKDGTAGYKQAVPNFQGRLRSNNISASVVFKLPA